MGFREEDHRGEVLFLFHHIRGTYKQFYFNISISELREGESKTVEFKSLSFAVVKIVVKLR